MLEYAVETAVNLQLHVALSSPAVAETLSVVIADVIRTDDRVDLFTSIMTTKPAPAHLRAALLTSETLRSIAAHLVTVPKEAIVGAVFPNVRKAVADTSEIMAKRAPEPQPRDATPLRAEMMTFINDALS